MSGRISIGSVDFTEFSSSFDRVCCVSVRSFLVRNWCGYQFAVRTVDERRRALEFDSRGRRRFDSGRTYREPTAGIVLRFDCRDLSLAGIEFDNQTIDIIWFVLV